MAATPDWLATSAQTRALAAWARERRLTYTESGQLPPVPAPGGAPVAREPYGVLTAGRWLMVTHDLGTGARTAADLDALAAEAARLSGSGSGAPR